MYFFSCHFSSLPHHAFRFHGHPWNLSTEQLLRFPLFLDSSLYAHYVFKAFDVNCNGAISFRVIN